MPTSFDKSLPPEELLRLHFQRIYQVAAAKGSPASASTRPSAKLCPECGELNEADSSFCRSCGTHLSLSKTIVRPIGSETLWKMGSTGTRLPNSETPLAHDVEQPPVPSPLNPTFPHHKPMQHSSPLNPQNPLNVPAGDPPRSTFLKLRYAVAILLLIGLIIILIITQC